MTSENCRDNSETAPTKCKVGEKIVTTKATSNYPLSAEIN